MKKERRKELFKIFEKLAEEKGTTVTRIAVENDISPNIMTYWKNGRSMPKADKLIKLAKAVDVPVETFI